MSAVKEVEGKKFEEIVLVCDKQDTFLINAVQKLYPQVSCILRENMGYHNAFQAISNHRSYGKGTLFIMMCGVITALKFSDEPECRQLGCFGRNFRNYSLVEEDADAIFAHLMNYASCLRLEVEANKCDAIIFTELFPPHLVCFELSNIQAHFKTSGHQIQQHSNEVHIQLERELGDALEMFNEWVVQDLDERGFSQCSMGSCFMRSLSNGKVLFDVSFTMNGRTLSRKSFAMRRKRVLKTLSEMLRYGANSDSALEDTKTEVSTEADENEEANSQIDSLERKSIGTVFETLSAQKVSDFDCKAYLSFSNVN